jgi:hypothetical protein
MYGKNVEYLTRRPKAMPQACFCFKLRLVLFIRICQSEMMLLNHLGQVQVGIADSQRDKIFITFKSLGKPLMLKQAVINYIG